MRNKLFKSMAAALAAMVFAFSLAGCAKAATSGGGQASAAKPVVYTTFFPVTDLTSRIVGDKMEVRTIIKGNQEPHDFELQTSDRAEISKADLIVYNGAGMEGFVADLRDAVGDDGRFLDLSEGLTLLQSKDAAGADHAAVNPHTWLSVKNAQAELESICNKVSAMDPANAAYYRANLESARSEFKALDERFERELAAVPADKRYFVASHAAFNYLADDYGLKQVAVTGISPEDEPSANQLATIADFVEQHGIGTIFFEGTATPKVAETLARTTGAKTSTLYTMERLTEDEAALGYLGLMERNLANLMESFGE